MKRKDAQTRWPSLWLGLGQIPTRYLRKLLRKLENGTPMLFNGEILYNGVG